MRTQLLYQNDMFLYQTLARVLSFKRLDGNKALVTLDATVFYPQSGGQPSDVGEIKSTRAAMRVTMVRNGLESKQVEHEGTIDGDFAEGEQVELKVDVAPRLLHSRIHSGGHLIDHAVQLLRWPLEGTKGFHFPEGPYVAYKVLDASFDASPSGLAAVKQQLETKCRELVADGRRVTITSSRPDELSPELLASLPEKARQSEIIRLVEMEGTLTPLPCGGTHVANTSEIGAFSIKKVSIKGDILRVAYACA